MIIKVTPENKGTMEALKRWLPSVLCQSAIKLNCRNAIIDAEVLQHLLFVRL
jgi:hypothetical protein